MVWHTLPLISIENIARFLTRNADLSCDAWYIWFIWKLLVGTTSLWDTTGSNRGGSKVDLRTVTARKENNEEYLDLDAQGPMITYSKNFQTQAGTNHWKSLSISISAKRTWNVLNISDLLFPTEFCAVKEPREALNGLFGTCVALSECTKWMLIWTKWV